MLLHNLFPYALALLQLPVLIYAQNSTNVTDVTVLEAVGFPCGFNVHVDIGPNMSYIDIVYSTKGTTPNNLVSYNSSQSQRRCYSSSVISHPTFFARARPLRMEISGSLKLDVGLTASVETSLVWAASHAMTNFTTATMNGPAHGIFTRNVTIKNRSHPSSCESATHGERSFDPNAPETLAAYDEPHLSSLFTISGTAKVLSAGTGTGVLVEDSELRNRLYVEWIPHCGSYKQWFDCVSYDRYDNPTYWYGADASTPGCIDYSLPPPSS
ncbi:hypothetical protein BDV96DRAFT_664322 [Lophiotrema nucula]|uniref:Uncharacterized protein n=1 Tax=Lophiotrema nucula TaxID=690887 RepID=A0A6A5Z0T9_9PLEO|nr:hypothetical protein BDV96DRAFT_664322 [Lophiotrema nucula]